MLRILVEKMAFVEFDLIRLAEIVVSSTPPNEILSSFLNSGLNYLRLIDLVLCSMHVCLLVHK